MAGDGNRKFTAAETGIPGIGFVLVRIVHVLAAMIWVGLIWYVNFAQLVAVEALDDVGRVKSRD